MNTSERLQLLLPWINGADVSLENIRERLWKFLEPYAGVAATRVDQRGHTRTLSPYVNREIWGGRVGLRRRPRFVSKLEWQRSGRERPVGARDLQRLRHDLRQLLEGGILFSFTSLRFVVQPSPEARVKTRHDRLAKLTAAERHAYLGSGRYVVAVDGKLRDLVLYQTMRLLTGPGTAALVRCPAPAPNDWSRECGRWLVAFGQRRGRPTIYCGEACRVRDWRKRQPRPESRVRRTKKDSHQSDVR